MQSYAHLIANKYNVKTSGVKYKNIIENLFPYGEGVTYSCLKIQKQDLIDLNKLVKRLRLLMLLMMSQDYQATAR